MPRFSSNGTLEKQKNLLFNSEEDYYQVTDVQFGEPTDIIGLNLQCNSHEQSVDEIQRRRKKCVILFCVQGRRKSGATLFGCVVVWHPAFVILKLCWSCDLNLNKGFDTKPLSHTLFYLSPSPPFSISIKAKFYEGRIFLHLKQTNLKLENFKLSFHSFFA